MALLRWLALPAIIGSILVVFSVADRAHEPLIVSLFSARRANAQIDSTVTTEIGLPTPTNALDPDATPSQTASADPNLTSSATPSPTAPPTFTETPVSSATGTATSTLATMPVPSATAGASSPTPTIDPSLPALSDIPDAPGSAVEGTIGSSGGRLGTTDGRATVDLPAGATAEELAIKITKRGKEEFAGAAKDQQVVGAWTFDAAAIDRQKVAVHQFNQQITITIRLSREQMAGMNPESLEFWTSGETAVGLVRLPVELHPLENALVVHLDHFSDDLATASRIVDVAPLLDAQNTNLHSGSSKSSLSIDVPPGRGGLTPELALSYDSGRVAEMRNYMDMSSWVGDGWELSTGSIDVQEAPDDNHNGNPDESGPRRFLNLNNLSGEILSLGAGQYQTTRDDHYARVEPTTSCQTFSGGSVCGWLVREQNGRTYTFGNTDETRRWYCETIAGVCKPHYYRFDLESVQDALGNQINFYYDQQRLSSSGSYVVSAYPSSITYNGGQTQVVFGTEWDGTYPSGFHARSDGPSPASNMCGQTVSVPPVIETRRLNNVEVQIKVAGVWKRVRKYVFAYTTTGFDVDWSHCYDGGGLIGLPSEWRPRAGTVLLNSIGIRGQQDCLPDSSPCVGTPPVSTLQTLRFSYGSTVNGQPSSMPAHWAFRSGSAQPPTWGAESSVFNIPLLLEANNGLGGATRFSYVEKDKGPETTYRQYRWTRQVVTEERQVVGAGQPDVVRTFDYGPGGSGPDQYPYISPFRYWYVSYQDSLFRGFSTVTERDNAGNTVVHQFFTTDRTLSGADWNNEVRTGREFNTVWKDSGGNVLLSRATDWAVRPVGAQEAAYFCFQLGGGPCSDPPPDGTLPPNPNKYYVNFVYAASTTETRRDNTQHVVNNIYDDGVACSTSVACYGLLTKVDDLGDPAQGTGAEVITNTAHNKNITAWLFMPQYEERIDPANALLSSTSFYYDGANTRSPAAAPARGLLTAKVTKADATHSDASYSVYDTWGNVATQSNPTFLLPESQTPPANPASGWVPAANPAIGLSTTTYDPAYHVYPLSRTNAATVGQTTTYGYADSVHGDFVFGKPTLISEPNGHVTNIAYDGYGRVVKTWDNLDTAASPTLLYVYNWGTGGNSTATQQKASDSGYRSSVSCMDGFGREVEHIQTYDGMDTSAVRTDYDARGKKAVVTNAYDNSGSLTCPASYPSVSSRDRTVYSYGPGDVQTTMSVAGISAQPVGPRTTVSTNGTTKSSIDELFRRTVETSNIGSRTKTVTEPIPSTILRPSGQGAYAQWGATLDFQNVNEATANDDGSQNNQIGPAKDTHSYAAAGVNAGTTISSVIFHFRWKEIDSSSLATNGVWPILRQSPGGGQPATDTRGTLHHRDNTDGWGDDEWIMPVNPRTNSPWQVTDFNSGSEFGFETNGASTHPYVTQEWVEIVTPGYQSSNTVYQYDRLGRLTNVTDPAGTVTNIQYDLLGRKIDMQDPDMGHWIYAYDAAGNLASQTDNRGYTTTIPYDRLQRPTSKSYSGGTGVPLVTYTYDTYPDTSLCPQGSGGTAATQIGRLTRIQTPVGLNTKESFCYDVRGRVETSRTTLINVNYDVRTTFDPLAQPKTITYPDGEVVSYAASPQGDIRTMTAGSDTLLVNAVRVPSSALASLTLGTQDTTTFAYDFKGRLQDIQTGTAIQHLHLTYDDASNVTSVNDMTTGGENVEYRYDQFDRVTHMIVGGQAVGFYIYNQIGNMIWKSESGGFLSMSYGSASPNPPQPHAMTSSSGYPSTFYVAYDKNGNLKTQGGNTYTYDTENRMTQRTTGTGATLSYDYLGDGTLLRRTTSGGPVTTYAGGIYERTVTGGVETITKYYKALGRTIAMRKGSDITYLLADHLGSTTTTLTNGLIAKETYYSYGAMRTSTGSLPTDKLFTGQQEEPGDSLGLYNYGARFYSTAIGRFMSVDPVVGNASNPQSWNSYTYVLNNPLRHVDPTGMCIPDDEGRRGCGADPHAYAVDDYQQQASQGSDPFVDFRRLNDIFAMQALANSGASVADLLAAAATDDPAQYLKQAYEDAGHGAAPALLEIAGDKLESLIPGNGCCIFIDGVEIVGEGEGGSLSEIDTEASGAAIKARGPTEFASRNDARYGTEGPAGRAAKKFFDDSTLKASGFKRLPLENNVTRFQYFSRAESGGYGKLFTLDLSESGARIDRFRQTIGPDGNVLKELHY